MFHLFNHASNMSNEPVILTHLAAINRMIWVPFIPANLTVIFSIIIFDYIFHESKRIRMVFMLNFKWQWNALKMSINVAFNTTIEGISAIISTGLATKIVF